MQVLRNLPFTPPLLLVVLLTGFNVVLSQRPHRQSRIEQVGVPEQVSEYRKRYHTTGDVQFALLDPDVALDGGVDEDDFELVLSDGTALSFQGLDLHDNEQEPGLKYWTKENDDMSSILLVFTDSVFGSKGVRGIIQNVTSGTHYEFSEKDSYRFVAKYSWGLCVACVETKSETKETWQQTRNFAKHYDSTITSASLITICLLSHDKCMKSNMSAVICVLVDDKWE